MIELTKANRKQIITALRTLGEKTEKLLDRINAKGRNITSGEEWIMTNLQDLEFFEGKKSLEKRSDDELYDTLTNFGMAAETLFSAIDGDHEFPNGLTALNIIDNFLKVSSKYSRPLVRG